MTKEEIKFYKKLHDDAIMCYRAENQRLRDENHDLREEVISLNHQIRILKEQIDHLQKCIEGEETYGSKCKD